MKKSIIKGAASIAALLFWVLVWHLVATNVNLSWILPRPAEVFGRLWDMAQTASFYQILFASFRRIFIGFLSGVAAGFVLGFLCYKIRFFQYLIRPLMATVKATPVASFILVVILWIQKDGVPGFISFLMVLPIVWQNTILGFERRDGRLSEMAKVFSFGPIKTLLRLDLPQVVPFVLSAAKTAMGLAWKAGVAAEVLALPKISVGKMIYDTKYYLETVDLYAWTVAIILFSVLLEKILFLIFPKKGGASDAASE